MVLIELGRRYVRAVMIDGYIPNQDGLKTITERLWNEKVLTNRYLLKRLRSGELSERQLLKIFGDLVFILRDSVCPIKDRRKRPSSYRPYTTKNNFYSIEKILGYQKRTLGKYLVDLVPEYRYDEDKNRGGYIQNLVIYRVRTSFSCRKADKCCENWINRQDFIIKDKKDYLSYAVFKNAWLNLLDHELDAVERFWRFKK